MGIIDGITCVVALVFFAELGYQVKAEQKQIDGLLAQGKLTKAKTTNKDTIDAKK